MSFVEGDPLSLVEIDLVKRGLESIPKTKLSGDEPDKVAALIQKCDDDTAARVGNVSIDSDDDG